MNKILFAASTLEHIKNFHIPYLEILNQKRYETHILSNKQEELESVYKSIEVNFRKNILSFSNIKSIFKIKN